MPFRHAKDTVVLFDGNDLSPFLNAATVSGSMDPAEVTNFGSGGNREYIKGLLDATLALEGFHSVASTHPSTEITDVLAAAFTGTTTPVVTVGFEDDTIGRRAVLFTGTIVGYDIDVPVDDVITTSVDLQSNNGYQSGVWLRALSQSTSTGASAAVDSGLTGGGTTGGGVAHLHVTAVNSSDSGSTGSATFLVQHSTSGSTWATLITFDASTEPSVQRSTVSGTVKEQLRATLNAMGTTEDIVTAAVAFARYGPFKG